MKYTITLIIALWLPLALAQSAGETLQDKLNAIRTMKAHFKQQIKAKEREVSSSSGSMALSRPGRFRWLTEDPMEQLVVADGQRLWIYDKALEQVTVKKQQKGVGGTAGLFLSGYDNTVARDFTVEETQKGDKHVFDLHAKSDQENFQRVKLIFQGKALKGLELYDQLGQRTYVTLTNIKINPKLESALFTFKSPKGVDVVEQ